MRNPKLLLVEDDALIALAEKATLEKHGYDVVVVGTGEAAIDAVDASTSIDLILMDINLGRGMDGTEAASRILERHDVPLIFLSSHTHPEVVERTEGVTSYGYIVKNSGETVLIASIKMAFRLFKAKMEAKEQQRLLRESEATARALLDAQLDTIVVVDANGLILDCNATVARRASMSKDELTGKSAWDLLPEKDARRRRGFLESVIQTGEVGRFEDRRGARWFDNVIYPIRDSTGEVTRLAIVAKDITTSKQLLLELQHRTMNSFNMITAMISLSSSASSSPEVKKALGELSSRINAIGRMHEILHLSESVSSVELDRYFAEIVASFESAAENISLQSSLAAITLPARQAIALGLITVELITNAVKHAFPDGRNGTVDLVLKQAGSMGLIEVSDDGVGLPDGFNHSASPSMGIALVNALARQVEGAVTFERPNGTRCVVEFPLEANAAI